MNSDYILYTGHVLDELKRLPDSSVHCCITSPPYFNLRNYNTPHQVWGGNKECDHIWSLTKEPSRKIEYAFCSKCKAWRGELGLEPYVSLYLEHISEIFSEVRRVLRPDGLLFLNIGDSTSTDTRRRYSSEKKVFKPKDQYSIPWRVGLRLQEDGWYLIQDIIWNKAGTNCPNCGYRTDKGSCMPCPAKNKLVPSHEYVLLLSKTPKYYFDYVGVQTESGANRRDVLSVNTTMSFEDHFAKINTNLTDILVNAGSPALVCSECGSPQTRVISGRKESSEQRRARQSKIIKKSIAPRADGGVAQQGLHIGTFPKTTLGWKATCNCNSSFIPGTILDPFSGVGGVGVSALSRGRKYIGIEISTESNLAAIQRFKEING